MVDGGCLGLEARSSHDMISSESSRNLLYVPPSPDVSRFLQAFNSCSKPMTISQRRSVVDRTARVIGLLVLGCVETALTFVAPTSRHLSIRCDERSAVLQSAAATVVVRRASPTHPNRTQRPSGFLQSWQNEAKV